MKSEGPLPEPGDENGEGEAEDRDRGSSDERPGAGEPPEQSDSEVPSFDEIGKPPSEDPLAWHPRLREAVDLLAGYSSPDLKEALISMNFVTEKDLLDAFATEYHLERVDWNEVVVTPELLAQVPDDLAWKHHAFPVHYDEKTLWVAIADPLDPTVVEEIQERVQKRIVGMIASEGEILRMLGMHYG